MRSNYIRRFGWILGVCAGAVWAAPARSQPWVIFEDAASGSLCGLVNTADAELVVLEDTNELVLVSGEDVVLGDTFVDADNTVFFDGIESGFIDFFEDGDGFATLWWVTLEGDVVELDDFSGAPTGSGLFPEEFVDVACDACEFWDDPADCEVIIFDEDEDGVEDDFDDCPGTPPGEPVDPDGCSCLDFDSDADGVDDCFDECPDTPLDEVVEEDGCSCFDFDSDGDGLDDCIDLCPDTPAGEDADDDGCSCFDFDDDRDGVVDCFDECPDTRSNASVDADGCSRRGGGGGGGAVIVCGAPGVPALALTVAGMMGLGLVRRRRG